MSEFETKNLIEDGGVTKQILVEGTGDETPPPGSDVFVHYTGRLVVDGTEFDSSRGRDIFKFKLGVGQVIKGWDIGVASMRAGERALITCEAAYAYGPKGSPPKIPPFATLEFDVELFRWTDMTSVYKDLVMKKILSEGDASVQTPNARSTVEVSYKGFLPDGTVFVEVSQPVKFVLSGELQITEGLEKAIESMKKGEVARFEVNAELGYGDLGEEKLAVPPNTDLRYEVTLINFDSGKDVWEMEPAEKYAEADRLKAVANQLYSCKRFGRALTLYKSALDAIKYEKTEVTAGQGDRYRTVLYSNMAATQLKLNELSDALNSCNEALTLDSSNVKCLFRRSEIEQRMGDTELALADLKRAQALEPDNATVARSLKVVKASLWKRQQEERKRYGGIFERLSKMDERESSCNAAAAAQGQDGADERSEQ